MCKSRSKITWSLGASRSDWLDVPMFLQRDLTVLKDVCLPWVFFFFFFKSFCICFTCFCSSSTMSVSWAFVKLVTLERVKYELMRLCFISFLITGFGLRDCFARVESFFPFGWRRSLGFLIEGSVVNALISYQFLHVNDNVILGSHLTTLPSQTALGFQ